MLFLQSLGSEAQAKDITGTKNEKTFRNPKGIYLTKYDKFTEYENSF